MHRALARWGKKQRAASATAFPSHLWNGWSSPHLGEISAFAELTDALVVLPRTPGHIMEACAEAGLPVLRMQSDKLRVTKGAQRQGVTR